MREGQAHDSGIKQIYAHLLEYGFLCRLLSANTLLGEESALDTVSEAKTRLALSKASAFSVLRTDPL